MSSSCSWLQVHRQVRGVRKNWFWSFHDNTYTEESLLLGFWTTVFIFQVKILCCLMLLLFDMSLLLAGVVSLFISTPPGHETERRKTRKNRQTFTALQDGTVSPTGRGVKWFDRRRRGGREAGVEKRRPSEALFSSPLFALRKGKREALKWEVTRSPS